MNFKLNFLTKSTHLRLKQWHIREIPLHRPPKKKNTSWKNFPPGKIGSLSRHISFPPHLFPAKSLSRHISFPPHLFPVKSLSRQISLPPHLFPATSLSRHISFPSHLFPAKSLSRHKSFPSQIFPAKSLSRWEGKKHTVIFPPVFCRRTTCWSWPWEGRRQTFSGFSSALPSSTLGQEKLYLYLYYKIYYILLLLFILLY